MAKHSGGRPTKYNEKYHVPWVRSLARRGLTVEEMADAMGVAVSTLYLWADKHEEFSEALNKSRSEADSLVEESLYRKALGMTVTETKKIVAVDDYGQPKVTRIETVERELAPDSTACLFWLKNRQPQIWRDNPSDAKAKADGVSNREWIRALGLE